MKTYRISSVNNFFIYLFFMLLTISFISVALTELRFEGDVSLFIAILYFVPLNWYLLLRDFDTIVIQDSGLITFRSPIRQVTVALDDITSIKPFFFHLNIIIEHTAGRIRVPRYNIEGLDDFLHTVKSMNPNIEVSD